MLSGNGFHGWVLVARLDQVTRRYRQRVLALSCASRGAIACSTRPRVRLKIALFIFERNQQKRLPVPRLF